MAYLTEYSYNQLVQRVDIKDLDKIDLPFFKKNIYDNDYLFYFFNSFNLRDLFTEKILLSSDENYQLIYKEVPTREDDLAYAIKIEEKTVKFHRDSSCKALNRSFRNFFIPEPIARLKKTNKEKHEKLVRKVRVWFKENNYTIEKYQKGEIDDALLTKKFNREFSKEYNIEPITISDRAENNFKWYIELKGGIENIESSSFNYDEFVIELNNLLVKRFHLVADSQSMNILSKYDNLYRKSDLEIKTVIKNAVEDGKIFKIDSGFIERYGLNELKLFWKNHSILKNRAMKLLSNYLKWTYNYSENTFDEVFLEDFNLGKCRICYR